MNKLSENRKQGMSSQFSQQREVTSSVLLALVQRNELFNIFRHY